MPRRSPRTRTGTARPGEEHPSPSRESRVVGVGTGLAALPGVATASSAGSAVLQGGGPGIGTNTVLVVFAAVGLAIYVLRWVWAIMDLPVVGDFRPGPSPEVQRANEIKQSRSGTMGDNKPESAASGAAGESRESGGSGWSTASPGVVSRTDEGPDRPVHATGTFEASPESPTMVGEVGFRPDLLFLTAVDDGSGDGVLAEGWSHGVVHRDGTGDIDQYTVSIADTGIGSAGGGFREDGALDLPTTVEADEGAAAVWGRVSTTAPDGFEFEVSGHPGEGTVPVQYHAIRLPSDAEASVGTFRVGSGPTEGGVPFDVAADYVSLTATTGDMPLTRSPDDPVAISHGTLARRDGDLVQGAIGCSVGMVGGGYAARNDRIAHLLHARDGDVEGQTSVRATGLGKGVKLAVASVHEDAPDATVVYVAVDTGSGPAPMGGLVKTPGPDRGDRKRVGTGFTPAAVSMAANAGVIDDEERTISGGLPFLGWTHAVVSERSGRLSGDVDVRVRQESGLDDRRTVGVAGDDVGFELVALDGSEGSCPVSLFTAWPGETE